MDIGSLTGSIELDDQLSSSLTLMSSRVQKFANDFEGGMGAMSVAVGTLAAHAFEQLGTMLVDAVSALPRLVMHSADASDHLRDLSNQTDVSVESLSQLRFVASQTGTSLDTIARVIFELGKRVGVGGAEIREALQNIGLSFDAIKAMKPDQAFVAIFAALSTLPTAADRAAAGYAIFGRQFRSISQLAKEDVAGLLAEAQRLGLTISTETAEQADQFNDALDVMNSMVENTKNKIAGALIPALTSVAEVMPVVGGAVLLLGDGFMNTAASLATMASGVVPALALVTNLGNTIPVLTARLWLMDVAQKAVALSTAFSTTAIGAFMIASGPVIVAIAAITAAVVIGYQAWKLYQEWSSRAAGAAGEAAVEQRLLAEASKVAGKQVTDHGEAMRVLALNTVKLRGLLPSATDAFDGFAAATKAAQAEITKLSDTQRTKLTAALKDGIVPLEQITKDTGLSSAALGLFKRQQDAATEAMKAGTTAAKASAAEKKKFIELTETESQKGWAKEEKRVRDLMDLDRLAKISRADSNARMVVDEQAAWDKIIAAHTTRTGLILKRDAEIAAEKKELLDNEVQSSIDAGLLIIKGEETRKEKTIGFLGELSEKLSEGASSWRHLAEVSEGAMKSVANGIAKAHEAANLIVNDIKGLLEAKDLFGLIMASVKLAVDAIGLFWNKLFGPTDWEKGFRAANAEIKTMTDELLKTYGSVQNIIDIGGEAGRVLANAFGEKGKDGLDRFNTALATFNATLKEQEDDTARLTAAIDKYGFSIQQLGPAMQAQTLHDQALELASDWAVLVESGIKLSDVALQMSGAMADYLNLAVTIGQEVPREMESVIQSFIDQGALLDENGNKITNMAQLGITFSETMTQGFDRVVRKLEALITVLNGGVTPAIGDATDRATIGFGQAEEGVWKFQNAVTSATATATGDLAVIGGVVGKITAEMSKPIKIRVEWELGDMPEWRTTPFNNNDNLSPGAFSSYEAWYANWIARNPGDESRAPAAYGNIPMAAGGIGTVTGPTSFLTGEGGEEEVAFSGVGKTFKDVGFGGNDDRLYNEVRGMRQDFERILVTLPANVARATRDATQLGSRRRN